MRIFRGIALAGAGALAVMVVGSGVASADPVPPVPTCDAVAVGSGILTPLATQWQSDYVPTKPNCAFASWDGTGPSPIQEKGAKAADPNCNVARPNGSDAGIKDLVAGNKAGDGNFCSDIARVAGPTPSDPGFPRETPGLDGVTWSANSGGHAPVSLTDVQLLKIYTAKTGSCPTWKSLGVGTSTNTIVPVLPQVNSDTRGVWLLDLSLANGGTKAVTPGSCVTNADGTQAIDENEGTNAVLTGANAADVIFPYSIGVNICQTQKNPEPTPCKTQAPGNLTLRQIDVVAPVCGTGNRAVINVSGFATCPANFPISYIDDLNLAFRNTQTQPNAASVKAFLQWVCNNATAQKDVSGFGFVPVSGGDCNPPS